MRRETENKHDPEFEAACALIARKMIEGGIMYRYTTHIEGQGCGTGIPKWGLEINLVDVENLRQKKEK